jgi:transposase
MSANDRNGTAAFPEVSSLSSTAMGTPASSGVPVPDPQVSEKASRRRFSKAYKLRILKEADACTKPGQIGALLRREGLYSSSLSAFRKQHAEGRMFERTSEQASAQRKERAAERQRQARRLAHLERENQKLRTLLEMQKKLADLLGIELQGETTSPSD